MKVVFDTHILIAGFLTPAGTSQYLLAAAVKRHTVILSEFILEEMKEKLERKLGIPARAVEETVQFLRKRAWVVEARVNPKIQFEDKKDIPILSLLEVVSAHYLVTGDKKLLGLKKWGAALILSPREAMEVL